MFVVTIVGRVEHFALIRAVVRQLDYRLEMDFEVVRMLCVG